MKANSPLEIYSCLPDACEELYGEKKMAVATRLASRTYSFRDFSEKFENAGLSGKYEENLRKIRELLAPAVHEIVIGCGEKAVTVGGDDVMFRHSLTFYNKTPIAVDVHDSMAIEELKERLETIGKFKKFYVGDFLTLDAVAVRSTSGNPERFAECVAEVVKTGLPVILCTKDPAIMKAGLKASEGRNPLMYAADEKNRKEMFPLALEYDAPLVISAPGDLNLLKSLVINATLNGISKIVLDPGTFTDGRFRETFQNFVKIRRASVSDGQSASAEPDKTLAWPIISLPVKSRVCHQDSGETSPEEADFEETVLTAASIVRYADLAIIHGTEPHELLPIVHMADMIYTDPRKPNSVAPGLYKIGTPDESSPVLFTTNFALTYYTVESDLASAGISCHLLAVNTGGLGVEAAVAGGQLTAQSVKSAADSAGLDFGASTHKSLVIPGLAARLQGDLEKLLGIRVLTGPTDSGRLPKWLADNGFDVQEK